jgi:hypothetical protein
MGFWEKAEKIALWLLIAAIPTQIGRHFWPKWSLVAGIRVDYLSVILYGVDILWFLLVIISLINKKRNGRSLKPKAGFLEMLVGIFILINILVAESKGEAIYSWLRIFQWVWFYKYCAENKAEVKRVLGEVIPWWVVGESLLGLAQMVKGGSLNGLFWWLGERRFDFSTMGIAQISVWGQGLLRAYGTFSHPNSLAGFLMVALGLWTLFYTNLRKTRFGEIKWWAVAWFSVLGIILSGSRTVWLLTLILMVVNFIKVFRGKMGIKKITGYLVIILGLFLLVLGVVNVNYRMGDFLGGWDSDSLAKRVSLNTAALKMWQGNLMIGVGAGNFISRLPQYQSGNQFFWLQPVHNIVILAGTEVGVLGLIITVWWFKDLWEKRNFKKRWWLLALIFLSGMVDHYWITLPQNTWLLAIVLGMF